MIAVFLILILIISIGFVYSQNANLKRKQIISIQPSPTSSSSTLISASTSSLHQSGDWELIGRQISLYDIYTELHLVNKVKQTDKIIGFIMEYGRNGNAIFSKDGTKVVFYNLKIPSTINGDNQTIKYKAVNQTGQGIIIYSIADNKIISLFTESDIAKALPQLILIPSSAFSFLALSPDNKTLAMSYGNGLEHGSSDKIVTINLLTKGVKLTNVAGIVKEWKNDSVLIYETGNPKIPKEVNIY